MSHLSEYTEATTQTLRRRAEYDLAQAKLELALINERRRALLALADPLDEIEVNRRTLGPILSYLWHGKKYRLLAEVADIYEAKGEVL